MTVQLGVLFTGSIAATIPLSRLAAESGLIWYPVLVVVNLFVLWFALQVVFAALDEKLAALGDGERS